jgi:hypothetical protein
VRLIFTHARIYTSRGKPTQGGTCDHAALWDSKNGL